MTIKDQFVVENYVFISSAALEQHLNEMMAYEYCKAVSVTGAGTDLIIVYRKMKEPDTAGQGREFWERWEKEHPHK